MRYIIVDFRISDRELNALHNIGAHVLFCPKFSGVYDAICGHPDIQLFSYKNITVVHKDIDSSILSEFNKLNLSYTLSYNSIIKNYPYDIILNCFILGELFVHNIKYTDSTILKLVKHFNLTQINVKQGYSKCSTAIINDKAIITSDLSIGNSLKAQNIDVLFVPPGDILLPGLDYGFIGGTCGFIQKNHLAFFGDINNYKYNYDVKNFLKKHKVEYSCLGNGKLIDRGSILSIGN
jgi:hypothetical protein